MDTPDNLTIADIDAQIASLREKKRQLKKTGKAAERKVGTLTRRRERLMERVREVDDQIVALRVIIAEEAAAQPKRRGRKPKSMMASA